MSFTDGGPTFEPRYSRGEWPTPVDIFATVKDGTHKVWVRVLEPARS